MAADTRSRKSVANPTGMVFAYPIPPTLLFHPVVPLLFFFGPVDLVVSSPPSAFAQHSSTPYHLLFTMFRLSRGSFLARGPGAPVAYAGRWSGGAGWPPASAPLRIAFAHPLPGTSLATEGRVTDGHPDFAPKTGTKDSSQGPESNEDLEKAMHEQLAEAVKEDPIVLFMKGTPQAPNCGFSALVVNILKGYRIPIATYNVLADPLLRSSIKSFRYVRAFGPVLHAPPSPIPLRSGVWAHHSRLNLDCSPPQVARGLIGLSLSGPRSGVTLHPVSQRRSRTVSMMVVVACFCSCSDWPTVPQLYVGGQFVGGADVVKEMEDNGELLPLLQPYVTPPKSSAS